MADEAEPEPWAFGMPVREPTRLLWAADATLRERLDRPWKPHPAAEPELEDFIESFAKVRNAFLRGDELGLRQAAQGTARYAPTLLRPLNPEAWADSPRSALAIVLAFDTAPSGYRRDMRMCLGMSDRAVTADGLVAASWRVTSGVLALARTHIEVIAPLLADDLAACLRDGSLSRYVRQLANDP